MDLKLKHKTAVVTGATAGIGLEIARSLALEGVRIIIPGRNKGKLDAAVEDLRTSGAINVQGVVADPATADGAEILLSQFPVVDILINNLGIYEIKPFADIADEEWRRYFDVNVLSGIRLARAYLKGMRMRNWGRVVFVSSESGLMTPGDMIHYGMTKTAQLAVSRGLANETRGTGITVNSVLPGPTRSEGIVEFLRGLSSKPDGTASEIEAEFFEKSRPTSILQRLIEPEEIAHLVTYLASPLSSATNGSALRVDGGVVPTLT